jgi:hypothetical protein
MAKIRFIGGVRWNQGVIAWASGIRWEIERRTILETRVYSLLANSSAIKRRVSTRIYPLVMPQDCQLPALTYQRISSDPVNHLGGYSNLENPHVMVNMWGQNYHEVKVMAEEVHEAMELAVDFKSLLTNEFDIYDPEVNLYAVSHDYSCWNEE